MELFLGSYFGRRLQIVRTPSLNRYQRCYGRNTQRAVVSAVFGEHQSAVYEQCFTSVLSVAREQGNVAIRSYRMHGDITRVLEEAGPPLCEPLRTAAYLIGHLDGLNLGFDSAPRARDELATSAYATPAILSHSPFPSQFACSHIRGDDAGVVHGDVRRTEDGCTPVGPPL